MIAVLDSGIGGFTVLRHMLGKRYKLIYVADTAFMPYGNRLPHEVYNRLVLQIKALFVLHPDLTTVVLACNTASLHVEQLQQAFPSVCIFDILRSAVRALKPQLKLQTKVGVFATSAVVHAGLYKKLLDPYCQVYQQALPELAEAIERGVDATDSIKIIMQCVQEKNLDIVLLGCTHYGFIVNDLQKRLSFQTSIFSSDQGAAQYIFSCAIEKSSCIFYTTSDSMQFAQKITRYIPELQERDIRNLQLLSIL